MNKTDHLVWSWTHRARQILTSGVNKCRNYMSLFVDRRGGSRLIFVLPFAVIKIPRISNWRRGVASNATELALRCSHGVKLITPATYPVFGVYVIVQRRCMPLSRDEWLALRASDLEPFNAIYGHMELKMSSFGWLNGRLIAIDFGGSQWP